MAETEMKLESIRKSNISTSPVNVPIKPVYKEVKHYLNKEKFLSDYNDALQLLGGDKLLKPLDSLPSIKVRKTSTKGVYKVIISKNGESEIKILDESQLINNEKYCVGMISKLNNSEYEIMYYDNQRNYEIVHLGEKETIEFLNEHNFIL